MGRFCQLHRQMEMVRVHESSMPINSQGGTVITTRFNVNRTNTMALIIGSHLVHGQFAEPCATISLPDKEIVDDGSQTAKCHAVAEGHHYIPNIVRFGLNEPDVS